MKRSFGKPLRESPRHGRSAVVSASLWGLCLLLGALGCQERIPDNRTAEANQLPAIAHPAIDRDLTRLRTSGVLRMITRYNSSNYFIHKGGQAGFDFELINHFAREQNLSVAVIVPEEDEEKRRLKRAVFTLFSREMGILLEELLGIPIPEEM